MPRRARLLFSHRCARGRTRLALDATAAGNIRDEPDQHRTFASPRALPGERKPPPVRSLARDRLLISVASHGCTRWAPSPCMLASCSGPLRASAASQRKTWHFLFSWVRDRNEKNRCQYPEEDLFLTICQLLFVPFSCPRLRNKTYPIGCTSARLALDRRPRSRTDRCKSLDDGFMQCPVLNS